MFSEVPVVPMVPTVQTRFRRSRSSRGSNCFNREGSFKTFWKKDIGGTNTSTSHNYAYWTRSRLRVGFQLGQGFAGEAVDLFLALGVVGDHELEADVDDADVDELFQSLRDLLDAAF